MDDDDILTTDYFAHVWGVDPTVAYKRMARLERKLGLKRIPARSQSNQLMCAYSKHDGEKIIETWRRFEARRKHKKLEKREKDLEIQYEINTANRPDVITVHELATTWNVSRRRASQIARRLEGKLNIQRVSARASSTQKIIAYRRPDGEVLVGEYEKRRQARNVRRKAKEKLRREREKIPQPPAPATRRELFYVIELWPGLADTFKLGWTSNIGRRQREIRTTNPKLRLVKSWPCERKRDREAMAYAFSFEQLERVGPEMFRTKDIQALVRYLDEFFEK